MNIQDHTKQGNSMSIHDKMTALLAEAPDAGVQKTLAAIAKATDENYHTGALLIWAKFLKNKKWMAVLKAAEDMHEAWGSLPPGVSEIRSIADKELTQETEQKHGKAVADKFAAAF